MAEAVFQRTVVPLLAISFSLPIALWLTTIRPYCLLHRQGHTPGATWGITAWVDWQQAREIAQEKGDRRIIAVCRLFLFSHIAFVILLVRLIWFRS
jgi:hypothetical protein